MTMTHCQSDDHLCGGKTDKVSCGMYETEKGFKRLCGCCREKMEIK